MGLLFIAVQHSYDKTFLFTFIDGRLQLTKLTITKCYVARTLDLTPVFAEQCFSTNRA
jgi:hypothetical protein